MDHRSIYALFSNRLAVVLCLLLSLLITGCSTILSASRDEPIAEHYGKRTPGAALDDKFIQTKSKVNLEKIDARFESAQIKISSYNGVVLLTGNVPESDMREIANNSIQKIRGVRRVHNELNVSPPRSFGAKFGDGWLTRKVKTRFMLDRNIEGSRVRVISNNGVMYLMGLVTREEADAIVNKAKSVYGLQKIVRVFEYID